MVTQFQARFPAYLFDELEANQLPQTRLTVSRERGDSQKAGTLKQA